ncbi:MAG: YHYH protein [Cellulophaga sp.]
MYVSKLNSLFITFMTTLLFSSCSKDGGTITETTTTVPAVYAKIYGTTANIASDGTYVIIKTNGSPDHKSVYYPVTNPLYEAYSGVTFGGGTFTQNPNVIASQSYTFKIPLNPTEASVHSATPLGPIGVALNGVPLYNQYAGPNNQALTNEINSFDKYYGHPTGTYQYHYHVEPLYLTTVKSTKSGLIGFLLDGFPVYGPEEENGSTISSIDLDAYHGHAHATIDYPNGTYHYHFTEDAPYMNGNGYYGVPGTITQ